ncbi:efflux RND transporter periplasmic adaptor subunit [Salmonella enterica subsp. enterica serovar Kottbus]|nr:efflux RND transporter periplasmic adaptor subunit [Salmonella enterica subsp. enterica serovar Kottbus]EHN5887564.1 efflux RND transporter periplasmic adaptor subunit [Salmonella enterica subsp. enterica serovar Newport]
MNRNRGPVSLAVVVLLSVAPVLTGCDNPSPGQTALPVPEVGVVTLRFTPLPVTTELPGRTRAYRIAEVRPQVSGIILKRQFVEGSDVRAGAPLYLIDPALYRATYDQALGTLAKARAAVNMDRLKVKRYQKLLGTQYISRQDYDNAASTLKQDEATVVTAGAAVETARINLAYTRVTAPIAGRTGRSAVTEGALVQNGQPTALTTVQQLDPIYVDVAQSGDDFLRLKQELTSGRLKQDNGKANVTLVTDDGVTLPQTGTLEFTDVTVDQTTGSITLHALFPNPDHTLLPGMFVRARLEEGTRPDALLVPQQGVSRTPRGEASVMVVGEGDRVAIRQVTAARAVGDRWLVTAGLNPGDRVIVTGLQKIRPGVQVRPQEVATEDRPQTADAVPPGHPAP